MYSTWHKDILGAVTQRDWTPGCPTSISCLFCSAILPAYTVLRDAAKRHCRTIRMGRTVMMYLDEITKAI